MPLFIQEGAVRPGNGLEAAGTIIQEQLIRLSLFEQLALGEEETVCFRAGQDRAAVDERHVGLAPVANIVRAVIGNVEVERAVAINIGQGHGRAAVITARSGRGRDIGEVAVTIIEKALDAPAGDGDEQIQKAVPVNIRKYSASA